jgi:hypothetical protein
MPLAFPSAWPRGSFSSDRPIGQRFEDNDLSLFARHFCRFSNLGTLGTMIDERAQSLFIGDYDF